MSDNQNDLAKPNEDNSTSMSQGMVKCTNCGVRLLISESYLIRGKYYCSEHRSNSVHVPINKKWYQRTWIRLVLGFTIFYYLLHTIHLLNSPPVPSYSQQAPAFPPTVVASLPPDETQFIEIVSTAQQESSGAENNMQKGGIKSIRDKNICKLIKSLNVNGWIATVTTLDSNSDGKGVLGVSLTEGITLKTWNNDFSDLTDHTLIEPNSALFNSASSLKVGQKVKVSGVFFKADDSCLLESSLSLDGKLRSPEYIFKFSTISRLN